MNRRNVVSIASGRRNAPVDPMVRGLLPWEDGDAFTALGSDFHREHQPERPTETSLTGQLVCLAWRRRRLVVSEQAAHLAALQDRLGTDYKSVETVRRAMIAAGDKANKDELSPALAATSEEDDASTVDNDADETMTLRAIAILETGDPEGYREALAALRYCELVGGRGQRR